MKLVCDFCNEKLKNKPEYESHIDIHTPMMKDGKIMLSGADQIMIYLKNNYGSWKEYMNWLLKKKRFDELRKAEKMEQFELDNKILFIPLDNRVKVYEVCDNYD